MRTVVIHFFLGLCVGKAAALEPVRLKEIRPDSSEVTAVGATLFFHADDDVHGSELWLSDGTVGGTVSFREFLGQPEQWLAGLPVVMDELLFFSANDRVHGWELWRSDGTVEGTRLVKDVRPGVDGSRPRSLTNAGGTLFFVADDGVHGPELWRSDGTSDGTWLVRDIRAGSEVSAFGPMIVHLGGTLYFCADDGVHGEELWKSDGTTEGTSLVKDIWPGPLSSGVGALTTFNGTVFFAAYADIFCKELWTTDGTPDGTVIFHDLGMGRGDFQVVPGHDTLFFGWTGNLWRTDGTAERTAPISPSMPSYAATSLGDALFSITPRCTLGCPPIQELWRSDGTAAGTGILKEFSSIDWRQGLRAGVRTLSFSAERKLWRSDGTAEGTFSVDLAGTDPHVLGTLGDTLFFSVRDEAERYCLWVLPADCNGNEVGDLVEITGGDVADANGDLVPDTCEISFLRGDCDVDGDACSGVNDALTLLGWLFRGDTAPPCIAACDTDGNGETELTDAVYGLDYCFSGTAPPPAPFPGCGTGTGEDEALGCVASPQGCN